MPCGAVQAALLCVVPAVQCGAVPAAGCGAVPLMGCGAVGCSAIQWDVGQDRGAGGGMRDGRMRWDAMVGPWDEVGWETVGCGAMHGLRGRSTGLAVGCRAGARC